MNLWDKDKIVEKLIEVLKPVIIKFWYGCTFSQKILCVSSIFASVVFCLYIFLIDLYSYSPFLLKPFFIIPTPSVFLTCFILILGACLFLFFLREPDPRGELIAIFLITIGGIFAILTSLPEDTLIVAVTYCEYTPAGEPEAEAQSVSLCTAIVKTLEENKAKGVPLTTERFDIAIKGITEKEKKKIAKVIGKYARADIIVWGEILRSKDDGTLSIDHTCTVISPLIRDGSKKIGTGEIPLFPPSEHIKLKKRHVKNITDLVCVLVGSAYLKRGDYIKAAETLETVSEPSIEVLEYLGLSYAFAEMYEKAIIKYGEITNKDSRNIKAWINKATHLGAVGKLEDALTAYDKSIALEPQFSLLDAKMKADVLAGKAGVLNEMKNYSEAIETCDKALKIYRKNALALSNKSASFIGLNDNTNALILAENALKIDKNFYLAWANKGAALANLKRYEEATRAYKRALKIEPNWGRSWKDLGDVLLSLNRNDEALNAFDSALKILKEAEMCSSDPFALGIIRKSKAVLLNQKGLALGMLGRHEQASISYNDATELDPELALAWANKAGELIHLRKHEDALKASEKALEIDTTNCVAWYHKGLAFYELGRYEESLEALNKATQIHPEDVWPWFIKAIVFIELGRKEEADLCIWKVRTLDPKLFEALIKSEKFKMR